MLEVVELVWNPKHIPDGEDAVILTAHQHTRHPTTILGSFRATRQVDRISAAFHVSDFDVPFRDAFRKARAYAQAHGIPRLYVQDPYGLGSLEVR